MPFVDTDTLTLLALETAPEVDLSSLPSIDGVPVCQMGLIHPTFDGCDAQAVINAGIAHQGGVGVGCEPLSYLLCDEHMREIAEALRTYRFGAITCITCGASVRRPTQLIAWRVRL